MKKLQFPLAALLLAAAVVPGYAQQPSSVQGADPSTAQRQDCGMDNRSRHDHGMEKGTGPASKRSCADMDTKKEPKVTESGAAVKGHDHGKFHKGQ